MPLLIQKCTIADLEAHSNFKDLVEEYAQESAIDGLPHPQGKIPLYKAMEATGAVHSWQAVKDGVLIGFLVMVAPVNPHYGVILAVAESVFVTPAQRMTGAGGFLMREANECAKAIGSPGILYSAKKGSEFAAALENNKHYTETNRVFFRKLAA